MRRIISALALGLAVAVVACSRGGNRAADSALKNDLSLAQQQHSFDSVSAAERANALNGTPSSARTTTERSEASTVRHRSVQSSGGTVTTTSGGTVVKHTQRDAAIGAAAGAILGATTSRNKVKGGLIGGALGGILGGVIGNNVDKTKKP